jgi:hypothetical protein
VRGPVEQNELPAFLDGQHLQQCCINEAENRGIRADAESEREDCKRR